MERRPPYSDEAEKSVLGAALINREALSDVVGIVKPEDFFNEKHKEIFETIVTLYRDNTPVDILTVCEELKKRNSLEMVGGRSLVGSLTSYSPSVANASEYAKIVSEKATVRKLINVAENISDSCFKNAMDADELLDNAERDILEIAQSKETRAYSHIKEVLLQNINNIDKAEKLKGKVVGLPTGFKDVDKQLAGLQKSDLIILAARPAMGKTALALNIAQNASKDSGATVIIFSLEMSKEQLGQRQISIDSRVELEKLKTGETQQKDWDMISDTVDRLSKTNLYIDDSAGIGILEMKSKCRRLKAEKGLDLVVIDYLQLMNLEGRSESRQQEISTISRYLKLMAKELDCPVIVLSQLSRATEGRGDKRPILSDLRDSGSIEQDADIVLFLYRDDYYNENSEKKGVTDLIIAKHRNGPTGTVELAWISKYTRFANKA